MGQQTCLPLLFGDPLGTLHHPSTIIYCVFNHVVQCNDTHYDANQCYFCYGMCIVQNVTLLQTGQRGERVVDLVTGQVNVGPVEGVGSPLCGINGECSGGRWRMGLWL